MAALAIDRSGNRHVLELLFVLLIDHFEIVASRFLNGTD